MALVASRAEGLASRLSQRARVVRRRLPENFMLAKDTFLRFILVAETVTVESYHPYGEDAELLGRPGYAKQVVVRAPGAQSVALRFDAQCESDLRDGLVVYRCIGKDQTTGKGRFKELRSLQGQFGGTHVVAPGSEVLLRFPMPRQIEWWFSSQRRGSSIALRNDR